MAAPREVADFVHNQVRRAKLFTVYTYASLADGASTGIVIKTGSVPLHLRGYVNSSGSALIQWHENTTYTASAVITPGNNNRYQGASGTLSGMSACFGASPDVAAACWNTLMWQGHIPADSKQVGGGGNVYTDSEWILNTNQTYVVGASNKQGATGPTGIYLEVYEDD